MNITPEQRTIGKQNFYEAVGTTRREFLAGTVAAAAVGGAGLGAMYFGYGASVERPLRVGIIGTGDEGGVLIGSLNPDYIDVVAIADIRPYNQHRAFHGDINNPVARPGLIKTYGWSQAEADKVKVYRDSYEDLINDDNVEAVIIALPLWLHDVAAFKAMRAGKHVLCEKLMAQTVARCKEMARLAEELKDSNGDPIVLAVGHQRHYSILYANAVDQIRRGLLGDLHHIRAQWHRANLPGNDSWTPPLPCPNVTEDQWKDLVRKARAVSPQAEAAVRDEYKLAEKIHSLQKKLAAAEELSATDPKKIDEVTSLEAKIKDCKIQLTDLTVNAEKYGYVTKTLPNGHERTALEELIRWRLWDRTAAGLMAELGSHQLDASSIFVSGSLRDDGGKVYPLSVQGIGFRSLFPADRDVDDHVHCNYEFPGPGYYEDVAKQDKLADPNKKIVVTYSSINGNGFGGYGEVVMGIKGTLILEREQEVLLYGGDANTKIEVVPGRDGKPAMATYETGGGAAVAQAATPKNVSRGYREEIEHWAWCIRNPAPENTPRCTPKVAMADAIIALVSNQAMKEQRRIEFDHKWFDIHDDATPEGDAPRKLSELA